MVNEVNLALYLICHHGHLEDVLDDARVIHHVSIEKRIPITYAFSGIQLDAILKYRDRIHDKVWLDVVYGIQEGFINPRMGRNDPNSPELAIMTYNHAPLVHPWLAEQREYLEGILPDQIYRSKKVAEDGFNITPVTFHPPDGIYAPAAAYKLKEFGLDSVIISGEHFLHSGNYNAIRHAMGKLYWASCLRHLMRTPELAPQDRRFHNAKDFVDAVLAYGDCNDISFVVAGCDIDEFSGKRDMKIEDGIARLCCIGDEAYRRGLNMINCNAASYWNMRNDDLVNVWGKWDDVHSMQNKEGNLGFIISERNEELGRAVLRLGQKHREGFDVRAAKELLYLALNSACRHENFGRNPWITDYFWDNLNKAMRLLQ